MKKKKNRYPAGHCREIFTIAAVGLIIVDRRETNLTDLKTTVTYSKLCLVGDRSVFLFSIQTKSNNNADVMNKSRYRYH